MQPMHNHALILSNCVMVDYITKVYVVRHSLEVTQIAKINMQIARI